MSDSDVDLSSNNVFTFQNGSTIVSAKGPNITASNLTGLSFRNNMTAMNRPRNFERQRYLEPSCDQRSMYYRRDTSPPISLHSASSFRPRNYQHMYNPHGMSSQRSMINGKSGSPMSMRSMDSNISVSAADIAMAFKNMNFNKYDLRVIKDAYNQFMKRRMRRKIEKRRNLRLFMKGHRRKSGYDSGELGSDSSISSDDCRSTRTAYTSVYRDNMSSCRSTKTDFSDFRRTVKEGNLYKDCSESFRQNTLKNILAVPTRSGTINTQNRVQKETPLIQKDRFKNGFLLPSQRFNQSVASVPIPENQNRLHNFIPNQRGFESRSNAPRDSSDLESEQDEIFSEITVRENSVPNADIQRKTNVGPRKRCLEVDDVQSSNKRSKLSSPPRQNIMEVPLQKNIDTVKEKNSNDFEFLKPQFPVRRSGNVKVKEKILAKSAESLFDTDIHAGVPKPQAPHSHCDLNNEEQTETNEQQSDLASTSDVSMRPSFIKRKLYTQKFDVLENKNTSIDNLASPQTNVYSAIQKEKHKARKLVTNQSCLSRDVNEDKNLLDLIHKIVPPGRMNVTNVTNKSEIANHSTKNKPDDDKWDITSVITTCNNDDVSDTYTDEEIFMNESSKKQDSNERKTSSKKVVPDKIQPTNDKRFAGEPKLARNKDAESASKKKSPTEKQKESLLKTKLPVEMKKVTPIKKKSTPEKNQISPNKKNSTIQKKASPSKKKSPTEKRSPKQSKLEKIKKCKVSIETLPVNKVPEKPNNKAPVPEKTVNMQSKQVTDNTRDKNKGKIYEYVKSFWDTDSESDIERVASAKKVKEKENNINHGNLGLKETTNLHQSSKTLDTTQSKFVWNNNSKLAVTLKSHCFSSQIKAININKSFSKQAVENGKNKKNPEIPESKYNQAISTKGAEQSKKAPTKKIVLHTYNSTLSDNTQNETVLNANNKSRTPRAKQNKNMKKNNDTTKKKEIPVNRDPAKTKPKSSHKALEKVKSALPNNTKPQNKQVDEIATSKRSPASPKEFTCCKEPLNEKSKIETKSKAKNKALDNYNSTVSDNTLEEIIKKGSRSRALRASRIKNIENSILDDLRKDDSQMLNMTLRSRSKQLNASTVEIKSDKQTAAPARAEEKTRNTSKSSHTKDTQSKLNKTITTPVKVTKSSRKKNSPRINNKVKSTPVHKRVIKRT